MKKNESIYNVQAISAKLCNGNKRKIRSYAIPEKMREILDEGEKTLLEILEKNKKYWSKKDK